MASIRDVAKRANVAACTVSRVLNGTANVAPETRMKIEQAMKELNYIPNELARSMFKQKAGIVAMLVPDIRHPYLLQPVFPSPSSVYARYPATAVSSYTGNILPARQEQQAQQESKR